MSELEHRPDTASPSPFVITVRYLDIEGVRWIAPLGTPDPDSTVEGGTLGWIPAGSRRTVCLANGTALIEPAELYQGSDWVTRRWRA